MLADLCLLKGWSVDFLGANTPTSAVIEMAKRRHSHLVALSLIMAEGMKHARRLLSDLATLSPAPNVVLGGQLVAFSYRLLTGDRPLSHGAMKRYRSCAEAIELIHAGSLIVDDIEDGSAVRRRRPALHCVYGMPLALNAGNWLYFWPAELLKKTGLSEDDLLLVYEHYHRALLRAHFGQALDLGARVDTLAQDAVTEVCLASLRLKTGALMGFCGPVRCHPGRCFGTTAFVH